MKSFSQRTLPLKVKTWPATIDPHSEQVGAISWKDFSLSSKVSFFNKASLWVLSFDWMRYQSLPWSVSRRWEGLCMWENKRFAPSKNPLEIMNSVRSWRPLCRSGISCTPGERMSCPPKTQRKGENCHQREMNQISWNLDMVSGDLALA